MNKKKGLIIGIIALVLLAAIACTAVLLLGGDREETILPAQGDYSPDYNSFKYEYSESMSIDGALDEDVWQSCRWYVNTTVDNIDGRKPIFYATATMDEYGIYIASRTDDSGVVNSGANKTYWQFWVAAGNLADGDNIREFKFKVDITGAIETDSIEFPRAVQVQGELNSNETEGATMEMFLPWQALGVDPEQALPEEFRIYPTYNAFFSMNQTAVGIAPVQGSHATVLDYHRFDENGYISADREDAIVGDTSYGYAKNAGWDVSQEADGILRSSYGNEHHRIFFKQYGADFIVEANITPVGSINNAWPKAGISFVTTDFVYHTQLLEFHESNITSGPDGTKTAASISLITLDNHNGNWNQSGLADYKTNDQATTRVGLKLTVIKSGGRFWYFVNDEYYASEEVSYMDTDVIPGFYTLGCDAIYTDYSCRTVTDDEVRDYLAEHNIYELTVDYGAGGTVTASKISITSGESYDLDILTKSGFEVSSILINGRECIEDARKNAKNGVYTVKNATGEQSVKVTFAKTKEATLTGTLTDSENGKPVASKVQIYGITNGLLHYEVSALDTGTYKCVLPNGKYRIEVQADGYQYQEQTVTVSGEMTVDFKLVPSLFAGSVSVNSGTAYSQTHKWDMTKESQGRILSSYALNGKMAPLFFKGTGSDFVVSTTIKYTTSFTGDQSQYQWDLMGGFVFNNGSTEGWVFARQTGLVKNGWKYVMNLVEEEMLICPSANDAKLTVAKLGEDVYFYLNDRCVNVDKWSTFCPGMTADEDVAIGLYNCMDKISNIEYTNYSLQWGAEIAGEYIEKHPYKDYNIPNSPFAESLTVNDCRLVSHISRWDLDHVKEGYVVGSYELETPWDPLFFSSTGVDFAVEATFEYDKTQAQEQWDLFGGFCFNSGTYEGWALLNSDGLVCSNWNYTYKPLVNYAVLRTDSTGPTKLALVKKGDTVYIYFNDLMVKTASWESISGGIDASAEVAVGLMMHTDKASTLKVSDYAIYAGSSNAQKYLNEHTNKLTTYSISYVLGGGKNPADAPASYTQMTAWAITLPTPTRSGYVFMGWYIGDEKVSSLAEMNANVTLTAKWQKESDLKLAPFAAQVTVGSNTVSSAIDRWDITNLSEGYVIGSYDLGTKWNGLYFANTATDFVVEATYEYDMTQPHEQWDLFGGFCFNDGNAEGWALLNSDGIVCSGWNYSYKPLVNYAFLRTDTNSTVKLAIAKQGDKVTFFIDDIQVGTGSWDVLSGGLSASAKVAVGLMMSTDKPSTLIVSDYALYTAKSDITAYIAEHQPKTVSLGDSGLAKQVLVGDTVVPSRVGKWDLSHLDEGYVIGSYDLGTKWNGLYFDESAVDFAVEATFEYDKTQAQEQWDLFGGFCFNSGAYEGWTLLNSDGLVCSNWNYSYKPLVNYAVLRTDSTAPTKLAIVKQGDTVTFFFNDIKVGTGSWSVVSGGIDATAELAIGLMMNTDKPSTLIVSDYTLYTNNSDIEQYIEDRIPKTVSIGESGFAQQVLVGDGVVSTNTSVWDLSHLDEGYVIGSYDLGTKWNGLYFDESAVDFAVEATFEYDKTQAQEQWDLFGGFCFNSTDYEGWALLNSDGIVCSGWNYSYKPLVSYAVLRTDSTAPTKLALVKQGSTVTIIIDDVKVATADWSVLSGGIDATAELAIGLMMNTDKPSTLLVSGYELYAGSEAAAQYLADRGIESDAGQEPAESTFAESVTVGSKTVTSNMQLWDLSGESEGCVIGSYALGTSWNGLYFAQTAVDFAVEATFEYDLTQTHAQSEIFGGFCFSTGSKEGWALLNGSGLLCTNWNYTYSSLVDYSMLSTSSAGSTRFGLVKQGSTVTFFIDGVKVGTGKWKTVSGSIGSSAEMAIGLMMSADKEATLKISDYKLYAGSDAAAEYVSAQTATATALRQTAAPAALLKKSGILSGMPTLAATAKALWRSLFQ